MTLDTTPSDAFRELDFGPWRATVCAELAGPFEEVMTRLGLERADRLEALSLCWNPDHGRTGNATLDLPQSNLRLHVRPLAHGGALARLTGSRFASLVRPLTELRVNAELARRGAPVPRPAFVLGRRCGWFWQAAVGTVRLEGVRDGVAFLGGSPSPQALEAAAGAAGRAVRRFHDFGGRHADLHIKNLVLREDSGDVHVFLVDLDRARIEDPARPRRRLSELMRLHRSLRKRNLEIALTREVAETFFAAYLDGDLTLREQMLSTLRFERLRNQVHARFHPGA